MFSQFEDIFKAKQSSPVGTEKTWGGKAYVKTEKGWRPKGKTTSKEGEQKEVKQPSEKVEGGKERSKRQEKFHQRATKYAKEATDKQLEAAVKDPDQDQSMKDAAEKELKERKESGNSVLSEKDALKQEIMREVDKRLLEEKGFKQITQTRIKVDGDVLSIKMQGEDKYRASIKGFSVVSEKYEPLSDFKERVKKEYIEYKKGEEKKDGSLDMRERIKQIEEAMLKSLDEKEAKTYQRFREEYQTSDYENFRNIMAAANGQSDRMSNIALNVSLIERGMLPIVSGLTMSSWDGEDYEDFGQTSRDDNNPKENAKFFYEATKTDQNEEEINALGGYKGSTYRRIRRILMGDEVSPHEGWLQDRIKTISNYIDKNRLPQNIILNRRIVDAQGIFSQLKEGDIFEDLSFSSFGLAQLSCFGSFQITLLAKKGQPVANIDNERELEFLVQKNTKFKVVATGTRSIAVQIVD